MNLTGIAKKLTHLKVKQELGDITEWWYKRQVSSVGRRYKYPRELGMEAQLAARSVMDIIGDYPKNRLVKFKELADVAILYGRELHLIKLDFETPANKVGSAGAVEKDEWLRRETLAALTEWLANYQVTTITRSIIFTKAGATFTVKKPAKEFYNERN